MTVLTAVDPGDVYVGVAFFDPKEDDVNGWECVGAQEFAPDEFMDALTESILANEIPILVFERFRIYEDKALEQTGSEMLTCQLIGQIKYIVRKHNEHCAMHTQALEDGKLLTCELRGAACMDPEIRWQPVLLVGQRTDIKAPTRGILRGKKIKSATKSIATKDYGGRDHIIDAELHGWYYILEGSVTGKDCEVYYAG